MRHPYRLPIRPQALRELVVCFACFQGELFVSLSFFGSQIIGVELVFDIIGDPHGLAIRPESAGVVVSGIFKGVVEVLFLVATGEG